MLAFLVISPVCWLIIFSESTSASCVTKLSENTHDVVLTVTVSAAKEEKTIYLVEIQQGGVFQITNVEKQERLEKLLNIRCPNLLFPYVSETIDSLLVKAGFPPMMLAPLNFRGNYAQLAASRSKSEQQPSEQSR